jgi:hypothetical protein
MKALVINCSTDYNLGVEKITNWLSRQGHRVTKAKPGVKALNGYDSVYLSALYTWDIPALIEEVKRFLPGTKIAIGGPAPSVMANYIYSKTGIRPTIGLDPRFEAEPGNYKSSYTSRGCIRNCPYCSVPDVEGDLREVADFTPAPVILDPNFLACSKKHIECAIEKLARLPLVDFLHGLDVRLLKSWQIELFLKELKLIVWRFTFDSKKNESVINRALDILKNYGVKPQEKVIIYCIYGYDDNPDDAYERARIISNFGAHPYAMRYQPMDALIKNNYVAPAWTAQKLKDFGQHCNIPTMHWLMSIFRSVQK